MKNLLCILLSFCLGLVSIHAIGKINSHTSQAKATLRYLKKASKRSPLFGHQDALLYGQDWRLDSSDSLYKKCDIYSVSGMYPYVLGLDLSMIEKGSEKNYDGCLFRQMREAAIVHHRRGGIITISWHMFNPLTGNDAWDTSSNNVVHQILTDHVIQDRFFKWLDRGADFINQLVDEKGRKIPILFRPLHECNIMGFWWSGEMCSNEEYIELWRLMHDYYVKTKHMNQLIWVYSPYNVQKESEILAKYPGDGYVDVIGYERYQLGARTYEEGATRFAEGVSNGIDVTITFAKPRKKIVAFTETGFQGIPYDEWWTNALATAIRGKNLSYVLVWRNGVSKKHYYGPCPNSKSSADFMRLVNAKQITLLKSK